MNKRVYWKEEDVKFLKENYNKLSLTELSKYLKLEETQVRRKANKLKLIKDKSQYKIRIWSSEETQILIDNYELLSVKEIMRLLPDDLTESQIRNKVTKLGLKKDKKWDECTTQFLIDNYKSKTVECLIESKELEGFSREAIYSKMSKLGISAKRHSRWNESEDNILRKYYSIKTNKEMLEFLPQYTVSQIKSRAYRLGLKKDNLIIYKASVSNGHSTKWTDEELKLMLEHYNKIPISEIQKNYLPNRTIDAIKKKANGLGLSKIKNSGFRWKISDILENNDDLFSITLVYKKEEIEC